MFVQTVMKTQNTMMRFLYSFDETFMDKEMRFVGDLCFFNLLGMSVDLVVSSAISGYRLHTLNRYCCVEVASLFGQDVRA